MKKTVVIFSMMLFAATSAMAQKETKKFSVGFGIEAGLPVGSYSSLYNSDIGVTIRFSYHAGPGFVTLTSGAIGFLPKKVAGQTEKVGLQIPVRAGYKYIIHQHFFVMGEVGFVSARTYYGSQGNLQSVTSGSFIAAPSAGVQFNAFEISIRYETHPGNNGGTAGLRIGFNF
jgi:hypothetical protein